MGESRRLLKNTGIIAVGGMATKLVQFFLLPLYTTVLSTVEYGTVDYINTIAIFLVPVVSVLMDEALFRYLIDCDTEEDRTRAVTASCAIMLVGCAAFAAIMLVAWVVFRPKNMGWVVALVISGTLLQMASAVLRGFGRTVSYALMNFIASAASIVMNVIFIAIFRWGATGMLSATTIAQTSAALAFLVANKLWRYVEPASLDRDEVCSMVRYSVPLIPNKVSWTIMNMLDRLVIMNTIGADAAGVYAVAYKFPNVMDMVYGFFYQSWKESSARVLGSGEDSTTFYNGVYRVLRRFMMGVVLGMTALMPLVYGLLIRGGFGEGLLYVPILLLATFYSNMSGFYGGIFTAYKDTGIMGTTTVVSAVLCVVLCLALIPPLGLWGASLATVASTFVVNEYRRVKVAKYARLEEDRSEQVLTIVSCVATFALYYVYAFTGRVVAILGCLVVACAFFLVANRPVIVKVWGVVYRRFGGARNA
ncbi:MAG: oligosaccharide flippase family protein [Olsenella sp.]|nr:oligosaccharide flippase family protein [Olsenella sp.]